MGRTLMMIGLFLLIAGAVIHFWGRWLPLGRLPGDIVYQKENVTFYFPLMTSLLASLALTGLFWLLRKL